MAMSQKWITMVAAVGTQIRYDYWRPAVIR
jgi:hypothetical protein